jgi:ABC-type transport system involved in Fe-S cluster assembly fused permease/ATPase subunit
MPIIKAVFKSLKILLEIVVSLLVIGIIFFLLQKQIPLLIMTVSLLIFTFFTVSFLYFMNQCERYFDKTLKKIGA